ncbi:MAG: sigma 54-interacting transcriptional regulator [Deltaproteobacteria bacterium]|nr:sigma 54-interacting transcriptional regulator [Deltaproteobacteria bacterium]
MLGFRSLLWIGPGEDLGSDLVADAPTLEFCWSRDVRDAETQPLESFDAIILTPPAEGSALSALAELRRQSPLPPVLVRVNSADATARERLSTAGAAGVILAGGGAGALLAGLEDVLVRRRVKPTRQAREPECESAPAAPTRSPAMRATLALVARAAGSRASVLLCGETGTGKEVLARAIHARGARATRPFVGVNCAAFPEPLLESELFGHVKGAFTGADRDKKGLFEVAEGGTLFLDEVGEMPLSIQAKLLRVLQERELRPVGGTRARPVDVRLVAATNRQLRAEIAARQFRADLYYRLAVFPINVPPLRERPEDILPLCVHFLALHGARENKQGCTLSREAASLLLAHRWPGNVRELENEVQRALALAEPGDPLLPEHFSDRLGAVLEPIEATAACEETLRQQLGRIEAWLIRQALDAQGGRRAATARRLGITREGLYKKMQKYSIS